MNSVFIPTTLHVKSGESARLTLPNNGVGGYLWTAKVSRGQGEIVEQPVDAADPHAVGGGADAVFEVNWPGRAGGMLVLQLKRPWEAKAAETHEVKIKVD